MAVQWLVFQAEHEVVLITVVNRMYKYDLTSGIQNEQQDSSDKSHT